MTQSFLYFQAANDQSDLKHVENAERCTRMDMLWHSAHIIVRNVHTFSLWLPTVCSHPRAPSTLVIEEPSYTAL